MQQGCSTKKYFKNSTKGCVKGIENNCHLDKRHAAAAHTMATFRDFFPRIILDKSQF